MASIFRDPASEIIYGDCEKKNTKNLDLFNLVEYFSTTNVLVAERLKSSKLQESCRNGRDCLEYRISKNEARCFYYLFQSIVNGKYEKFVVASKDWRKMTEKDGKIMKHESSKAHQSSVENY